MTSYSFESDREIWTPRDNGLQCNSSGQFMITNESPLINLTNPDNHETEGKWPLNQIMKLLRLYGTHDCLWNMQNLDNRKRKLRNAALIDIAAAMSNNKSKEQIVKKINILRATYRYEKKRIKLRIAKGLGVKTKLKWFALADAFLRKVPKSKTYKKEISDSGSELDDAIFFPIDHDMLQPLKLKKLQFSFGIPESEEIGTSHQLSADNDLKISQYEIIDKQEQKFWSLDNTMEFLKLLDDYTKAINPKSGFEGEILNLIAQKMAKPLKTIEKRYEVLSQAYKSEKHRLDQQCHRDEVHIETQKFTHIEKIFLNGIDEENDVDEYQSLLNQNPIPSVSSITNLNEDLNSLFNWNANPMYSEESIESICTDPAFGKKDDFSKSNPKLIWPGLEIDLLESKWSLKHSVKFLRLYGVHKCLWHLNNPDYRCRSLRKAAIEDIAAAMGRGLTAAYVNKKIKIFRITYMQQRKRMLEAREKGQKLEIMLKWFPLADSFLRPHIGLRSIKARAEEIPQFDYQYVYANLNLIDPDLLDNSNAKDYIQNSGEVEKNA